MQLQSAVMYNLEIVDLNSDERNIVTAQGYELDATYSFLQIGQVVNDWKLYIVTPLCE